MVLTPGDIDVFIRQGGSQYFLLVPAILLFDNLISDVRGVFRVGPLRSVWVLSAPHGLFAPRCDDWQGPHGLVLTALRVAVSSSTFLTLAVIIPRRVALGGVVLWPVPVVDEVYAAQIRVSVVVARLVLGGPGRLCSRGTWLIVGVTVGTDDERGIVSIVQAISGTIT